MVPRYGYPIVWSIVAYTTAFGLHCGTVGTEERVRTRTFPRNNGAAPRLAIGTRQLGIVAGDLTSGGPYANLPIAAGLVRSGAGIGTMVAFLTSWSLWAVGRIPMEVGILGWRLTLIRIASTFLFPPTAGLIAEYLLRAPG